MIGGKTFSLPRYEWVMNTINGMKKTSRPPKPEKLSVVHLHWFTCTVLSKAQPSLECEKDLGGQKDAKTFLFLNFDCQNVLDLSIQGISLKSKS